MCRSEGCARWLSGSEANGTHRCGSCELVPPVVFQAEQWPATRKPGDRDRDALILLPLDARHTQTAGRGGATADGVAFDAIEFVAEFSWRRVRDEVLSSNAPEVASAASIPAKARCRTAARISVPMPPARWRRPSQEKVLACQRSRSRERRGFAGRRSGRLRRPLGPGPGRPPTSSRGAASAAAPPNARSAGGRPLRDTGKGV